MSNLFIHRNEVNFDSAHKSIELYKKLLLDCSELKNNFLKNAKNFYNQLTFDELNKECYFKLYAEINSIDKIKPLSSFYGSIEGLENYKKMQWVFF